MKKAHGQKNTDRGYNYFYHAERRGWSDFSLKTAVARHYRIDSPHQHREL